MSTKEISVPVQETKEPKKKAKTKIKTGYVYIITSKTDSQQNIFKIGTTKNLKKCLKKYNADKSPNDLFYYCFFERVYNPNKIKGILLDITSHLEDRFEGTGTVNMNYKCLEKIVMLLVKLNEPYEYVKNIDLSHKLDPVIPEEMPIVEEEDE